MGLDLGGGGGGARESPTPEQTCLGYFNENHGFPGIFLSPLKNLESIDLIWVA